ncbi:hypothetical protein HPB49_021215 [Dermacentor silvarum]|uniref:Uncharacterized protein n=1 Tax=Dermacentor silvarum TaxID=543639 RepID=A0ACB8E3Z8_DERSI|nr:hypothetical protein HPB49_021215 [Dermacentor silvarum]
MALYRSAFGFSKKVLEELKQKTQDMDPFKKHGGLLVDELKLLEHLSVKQSGQIEGFVDLGEFTTAADKTMHSDHGMVILFVPFVGGWTQVIGTFATKGNIKGDFLAQVMIDATILTERSGLFVDFITCDGATWNRRMWKVLGVRGTAGDVKCKVEHPVDDRRHLHFISDFPHLIKCLRNGLMKCPFNTPDGHVTMCHVREAYKIDSSSLTLKAMPGITKCHLQPNSFEQQRVSYAFQLFGERVLQGLHLYKADIEAKTGPIDGTQEFFRRINRIICVMTSRFPGEALRPNSSSTEALSGFLKYLAAWEKHAGGAGGFLSESTATGLRFSEDCKIRECGCMCSKCLAGYASEQHQLPSQQQLVGSG